MARGRVNARGVDPRDGVWEDDSPRYRVYFEEGRTVSGVSEEFEIDPVGIEEVLAWAQENATAGAPYSVYVVAQGRDGVGLLCVKRGVGT